MISDLIYDVGMHDGCDTAFYLSKGFRVVAIEANPALVERARHRFAADIESGRVTILNVAVAPQAGPIEFWVNEKNEGWSSLQRRAASRQGTGCHPIKVEGRPFRDILAWLNFSLCYHRRGTLDPWGYFDFHATTRPLREDTPRG
jgi:FkbM family methyltransferase